MKFKPHFTRRSISVAIAFFVLLLIELTVKWIGRTFGRINMDEIALVMQIGMRGVDGMFILDFLNRVLFRALVWTGVLTTGCAMLRRRAPRIAAVSIICAVLASLTIVRAWQRNFQVGSFFETTYSTFYEDQYISPDTVTISFPTKRSVLVIALESMEKAYADADMFGAGGLTPNITQMERENVSFERYDSITGLTHTIAAITGFTTGLPLFFTSHKNIEKMLGATGIGTVFKNNGYKTVAIFPASGKFSLKESFMRRMGFDDVTDGVKLGEMLGHRIKPRPFGGVDDGTMFEISKAPILDLINSGAPYFLFMETVNTHLKGYRTQACADLGYPQETMEDIIKCDDKIIADFIAWFRKNDPNAVVILLNDHPQHAGPIMQKLTPLGQRHLANAFINTPIFKSANVARPVLALDFFPTIIEAAGGIIDGCRLGLGTALSARCAATPTLRERYDDAELAHQMEKRNKYYMYLNTGVMQ